MRKPITISFSANIQKDDVIAAFKLIWQPWRYVQGGAIKELERWFRTAYKVSHAISFINGRSSLYAILHCLDLKRSDEVIIQAFTTVQIPNAILSNGAKPIYVDIDNLLNIDPKKIEKVITKRTKAIIIQHTFGIPAKMDELINIVNKHNLFLIEDCSHTIGGEYKGQKLGTFGIASCFSFGRTKAFSSIFGGMAITNDKLLGQKIRSYQKQKNFPIYPWVLKQLLYRIISSFIFNVYYFLFLGKILHFFFKRSRLFSETIGAKEKKGEYNPRAVKRLPNALASLALLQLKKQKEYNQTRKDITDYYQENLMQKELASKTNNPLLRFPLLVADKQKTLSYFAKKGIYLGDWFSQTVDPQGVDLEKVGYTKGSCPIAEDIAQSIINLPTNPTLSTKDAEKIVSLLKLI